LLQTSVRGGSSLRAFINTITTPSPEPDPAVLHVLDGARRSRRWTWIALGVVAIASVAGFVAYQGKPVNYRTAAVERGPLVQTITAVGQLEALQSVDVSSQLSGQVAEVLVDANDRVTAGQVLARLDATPFELAVRQSRAQVDAARASQRQAEVSVTSARLLSERTARLVEKGAATTVEAEDVACLMHWLRWAYHVVA
jgi:multidrug efflux pump subunit AcrA (membrane-fusion protein)